MHYRREIDGLRALAVLPVILFHAGFETFSGGFVGVDVFFVISGYLITTIILSELEQEKFSIINFYERRARRILPALFFVMLICIPFAWFYLLPSDMKDFSQSLVAVSIFSSNILFWRNSGYFDITSELRPLLHTWSLAVEEQFYVIFPLLLILFWRSGKRFILNMLIIIFIISLAMAQWASYAQPTAAFFLLPTRGWELLIGTFNAFYLYKKDNLEFSKNICEICGWSGLILLLYSIFTYSKETPFPGVYALVPTIGTALIILFATQKTAIGRFIGNKAFVGVGLISYSAYLWHQPLFAFARHINLTEPSHFLLAALSVATIVLAYFTWRYVEHPFREKNKITRSNIFIIALIGSFFFSALGLYGHKRKGDLGRYPSEVFEYFDLKAESDDYVWKSMKEMRGASFNSFKIKILIIGDSNSGDLLNILSVSDVDKKYSFSTLLISTGCGNLFLPKKTFENLIEKDRVRKCSRAENLMSEKNKLLISQADWVFFASNWRIWESNLLLKSYSNLVTEFGDKFWFFGSKRLDFSPNNHIQLYQNASFPAIVQPNREKVMINNTLKSIANDRFINPYDFFCDSSGCKIISSGGDLIIYDGFHLTKFGTTFFSEKLQPLLSKINIKP